MKTLHINAALLLKKLFRLERCGKYDEALAELRDIWDDTTKFPDVEDYESRTAAEIILRCGAVIGFLGHNKQIPNSQEKSKNLLTEARNRFLDIYDVEKIAECENYLSLAYWRTGELVEAESFIEEALSHNLSNSNHIRLYSYIIQSKIDFANSKYEKVLQNSAKLENDLLAFADNCLKGDFYNHSCLALKNLGNTIEALKKLELARHYHQKAKHLIYLGTDENNLAQLYKLENRFVKAHEAIDNAAKIFKQINDRTREGFSLDTKAQIYFAEKKYEESLETSEKAIAILTNSENKSYLVETLMTKAKTLIFLENDISIAMLCLFDAVQIARTNISEDAAKGLIKDFEKARQEKS
jgi:tetratricopeptide (TPR) repeat protein